MQARLENPAGLLPDTMQAINILYKSAHSAGVDPDVLELVHLRGSQINGCAPCVESGARNARKNGWSDERLFTVAVWRETPFFSDAERAALDLAEHATRMADTPDAVPDAVWAEAARHFDDRQLAAIVLWIAVTNFFNRINVTTRQQAPQHWG
ncbi:carboxymuconolactone decarboxylase family protein [Actinoplanes sp. URMC 104]|uniref:carboxymuconolactone decarboxylase family protein n=1 Tax=Actinoplanes sp. URMC 104 TaxID=3423409 RepID=UPI003F19AEC9